MSKRLEKICCEICGEKEKSILEKHHITPRTDPNCTNDDYNLAVLCPKCHALHHAGKIKIIGVFPSTNPINGRTLVYESNGIKNADVDEPYYVSKAPQMKIRSKEDGYK